MKRLVLLFLLLAVGGMVTLLWNQFEVVRTVLGSMGQLSWTVGGESITLAQALEAVAVFVLCFGFFLLISPVVERGITRAFQQRAIGALLSRIVRVAILAWGALVALAAAGIGIGAFAAFFSAVGVGVGLAVRSLSSNYVSGLILLLERSLRIGDSVRSGPVEGRVTGIGYRASSIFARGTSTLVPNDALTNSVVQNLTLSNPNQLLTTELTFDQTVELSIVTPVLVDAIARVPEVVAEPGPVIALSHFSEGQLEVVAQYWVEQPARGIGAVRSDVNLEILHALRRANIPIGPKRHRSFHR